jgi:hypothetical protein
MRRFRLRFLRTARDRGHQNGENGKSPGARARGFHAIPLRILHLPCYLFPKDIRQCVHLRCTFVRPKIS